MYPRPSDDHFDRLESLVRQGAEPSAAALELGHTLSDFRRTNRQRHLAILAIAREERANYVDRMLERWSTADDAPPTIRLAWARRWNQEWRERAQLEVVPALEGEPLSLQELQALPADELERRWRAVSALAAGDDA